LKPTYNSIFGLNIYLEVLRYYEAEKTKDEKQKIEIREDIDFIQEKIDAAIK
jgi:hypothetical protein